MKPIHISEITGTKKRRRKFGNKPIQIGTDKFDSRKEARRWRELLIMQRARLISDLKRQVRYKIEVNGLHVCTYVADFTYKLGSQTIVEDAKSPITRTHAVYRLKAKLMKACHGISIREV